MFLCRCGQARQATGTALVTAFVQLWAEHTTTCPHTPSHRPRHAA
ncbi:hypothetical protein [Streptomyces thermolineatus]